MDFPRKRSEHGIKNWELAMALMLADAVPVEVKRTVSTHLWGRGKMSLAGVLKVLTIQVWV